MFYLTTCPMINKRHQIFPKKKKTYTNFSFNKKLKVNFDLKPWICVSYKIHIPKIVEDILKDGTGDSTANQDMNISLKKLHDLLNGNE